MRDRDRVAALIIRDKKLLLVTGPEASYYWTPGGKIEEGEDHEKALRREIREELGAEIINPTYYTKMEYINQTSMNQQTSYYYLATMEGELTPAAEITDYGYFDLEGLHTVAHLNFMNDNNMVAKLVADGLIA